MVHQEMLVMHVCYILFAYFSKHSLFQEFGNLRVFLSFFSEHNNRMIQSFMHDAYPNKPFTFVFFVIPILAFFTDAIFIFI